VGTPDDFYFLGAVHRERPEVETYGYDIFPKKAPSFITMLKNIGSANVDLLIATHVLEHIPDAPAFVRLLPDVTKDFLVEVPEYADWRVRSISRGYMRTKYHYHFFTRDSFARLFAGLGCVVEYRTKKAIGGDNEKGNLVAHNMKNRSFSM
jgi:hypothetical protein